MNKTFFRSLLAVSLITTLLMAGCQKDSTTLRVRIDNFGGNSKVYMGGDILNIPMWSQISGQYDTIWINHSYNSDNSFVISEFTNTGNPTITVPFTPGYYYCALYPFGIGSVEGTTATLTIPQEQRYYEKGDKQVVNAPMGACTQNDASGSITFHNLGALLAINIETNTPIDVREVRVKSESGFSLWGTAEVNLSNADAFFECSANTPSSTEDPTHSTIYLRKYRDVNNNEEVQVDLFTLAAGGRKTVYVYVPAVPQNVNNYYTIEVEASYNGEDQSMSRTQESTTGGNLVRNMMVNVPFSMQEVVVPDGAISGKFTINANGDQVYFAQGNLQWRPSTTMGDARSTPAPGDQGHWRIAKNQYDFIGNGTSFSSGTVSYDGSLCNNESIYSATDDTYSGWIDLFGWATSGWNNTVADPTAVRYHPYDYESASIQTIDNWRNNRTHYGPATTRPDANYLNGSNANYDWGVYHSNSSNGGINYVGVDNNEHATSASWRTLTYSEWHYIMEHGTYRRPYRRIQYCGVYGFLLYPDNYSGQYLSENESVQSIPSGCVFLPVTGYRTEARQIANGTSGCYWTASSNETNGAAHSQATYMGLNTSGTNPITYPVNYRYIGCAVRLVTPVQ